LLIHKTFSTIRSRDVYTAKFPGTLSRTSYLGGPLETRWRS